eukprot:6187987-Pleurochrysis_carterae.AAC.4
MALRHLKHASGTGEPHCSLVQCTLHIALARVVQVGNYDITHMSDANTQPHIRAGELSPLYAINIRRESMASTDHHPRLHRTAMSVEKLQKLLLVPTEQRREGMRFSVPTTTSLWIPSALLRTVPPVSRR